MFLLFTLCYFFSPWCAFLLPAPGAIPVIWLTLSWIRASAPRLMDLSWLVTTEDLLLQLHFLAHPCLHMYIFWMEEKAELIFKSQVLWTHMFWIQKWVNLIWSGPKNSSSPSVKLFMLQLIYPGSEHEDRQGPGQTLCDSTAPDGVGLGKKATLLYVLPSPLYSFHYPLNLHKE